MPASVPLPFSFGRKAGVTARFLLRDARLFDPLAGLDRVADLLVEDGQVAAIGHGLRAGAQVIEAGGWLAFPGFIDLHVHLREPGQTAKEDIASGSLAASRGGFAAVVAMANTEPAVDSPERLRFVLERAAAAEAAGGARVLPCAALTRDLAGERPTDAEALAAAGAVALSDDGRPVRNAAVFLAALRASARAGLAVLDHCEDPDLADAGRAHDGPVGRTLGVALRPAIAETVQAARDIALAREAGARLHIQHISVRDAVDVVRRAKAAGDAVTAEATPHHLLLTEDILPGAGGAARVNPPLREEADRAAVWQGLSDGTIDAVATDHAPHTRAEKDRPLADALPGISGLETAVALLYQEVRAGRLSLDTFVSRFAYGPAAVLGRAPGRLAEGVPCLVTLFAPEEAWSVDPAAFVSRGRTTPFSGRHLIGRPTGILTDKGVRVWRS